MHGEDKGLVTFNEKPLIEHVIQAARPQAADIVISANRNMLIYQRYGYPVIRDRAVGFAGPLAGIASTIPACKHDWILVLPCDMPFLPADIAMRLYRRRLEHRLVATEAGGRLQLVFLLHRSLQDSITAYIAAGRNRVMSWLQSEAHGLLVFDSDAPVFSNINRHEDLEPD